MKKKLFFALITILLTSCSSNQDVVSLDHGIMVNQMISKVDNKKLTFSELVFGTQHISKQTDIQQVLFENYGTWTSQTFSKGAVEPILIWENILLLEDSKEKFTLVSYGGRLNKSAVATLLVLDAEGNDVFSTSKKIQSKVVQKITLLLKNKSESQKFLMTYLKTFHPTVKNAQEYVYGHDYSPIRIGETIVPGRKYAPYNTDSQGAYVLGINFWTRSPSGIAPLEDNHQD